MSNEQKLLVILSKWSLNEKDKEFALKYTNKDQINWDEVWIQAVKNKTLGLVYYNLVGLNLEARVPERYLKNAVFFYLGNKVKNEILLEEYNILVEKFERENINFAPLKGIALLRSVYKDIGVRELSDIDLLVNVEDKMKIEKALDELGFVKGHYNLSSRKIEKYEKMYEKLWKMKMNTFLPYVKKIGNDYLKCIKLDISINLDIGLLDNPVQGMLQRKKGGNLDVYDFIIQLCCHLYKEATNAEWIYQNKDLNIIKFCDIREYYLCNYDNILNSDLLKRINETNTENAVYYTLYYLKEIYNDGYEDYILQQLNVDNRITNLFGKNNFKEEREFKKTFWERLFSNSNRDELDVGFCEKYKLL